jgi:hypothetical protein
VGTIADHVAVTVTGTGMERGIYSTVEQGAGQITGRSTDGTAVPAVRAIVGQRTWGATGLIAGPTAGTTAGQRAGPTMGGSTYPTMGRATPGPVFNDLRVLTSWAYFVRDEGRRAGDVGPFSKVALTR